MVTQQTSWQQIYSVIYMQYAAKHDALFCHFQKSNYVLTRKSVSTCVMTLEFTSTTPIFKMFIYATSSIVGTLHILVYAGVFASHSHLCENLVF
jgi:hypothetical protein